MEKNNGINNIDEIYDQSTQAEREHIFNNCDGQFTSDFAARESGKNWNQLPIFVQKQIMSKYEWR
jgi:hypothetical protein